MADQHIDWRERVALTPRGDGIGMLMGDNPLRIETPVRRAELNP